MKLLAMAALGCMLFLNNAPAAKADGCDDIAKIADRWHKLSTYIDDRSDNGKLRKKEIAVVSKQTKELTPFTKAFGDELAKITGKSKEESRLRAMGKQISAAVDELGNLGEDDDWDEDVKIIDRIVEILDKVSEACK